MSLLLPIAAGAATSVAFEVYPRTQSRVSLIDVDGATIPRHAQVKIQWRDLNGQWYDHSTLSGGLDTQFSAVLEPGTYRVLRVSNNIIVGVELDSGTERAGATVEDDAPADTTRAISYGWADPLFERIRSALGQLFVRIHGSEGTAVQTSGSKLTTLLDGERFAAAAIQSVTVADAFVAFPSYAASYLELSNPTTDKVIAYQRGTTGAEATLPPGATRRVVLPAGNANGIRVRNATDATSLTITADAVRRTVTS